MKIGSFTFNPFQENTYIAYDTSGHCVIVDPGCYDRSEQQQLLDFVREHDLTVKAVLNTHCHIDHVLGNAFCLETWSVPLYAHREELFTLSLAERSAMMYGLAGYVASPEPTHFVEDGQELQFGELRFQVIFAPGHSIGHVAFYNEEQQILLGGDILFRGSFGRTDLPGGSQAVLKKSILERILTLPDETIVLSGHGPYTTVGAEKDTNPIHHY